VHPPRRDGGVWSFVSDDLHGLEIHGLRWRNAHAGLNSDSSLHPPHTTGVRQGAWSRAERAKNLEPAKWLCGRPQTSVQASHPVPGFAMLTQVVVNLLFSKKIYSLLLHVRACRKLG
jgi:hypothetical protein